MSPLTRKPSVDTEVTMPSDVWIRFMRHEIYYKSGLRYRNYDFRANHNEACIDVYGRGNEYIGRFPIRHESFEWKSLMAITQDLVDEFKKSVSVIVTSIQHLNKELSR